MTMSWRGVAVMKQGTTHIRICSSTRQGSEYMLKCRRRRRTLMGSGAVMFVSLLLLLSCMSQPVEAASSSPSATPSIHRSLDSSQVHKRHKKKRRKKRSTSRNATKLEIISSDAPKDIRAQKSNSDVERVEDDEEIVTIIPEQKTESIQGQTKTHNPELEETTTTSWSSSEALSHTATATTFVRQQRVVRTIARPNLSGAAVVVELTDDTSIDDTAVTKKKDDVILSEDVQQEDFVASRDDENNSTTIVRKRERTRTTRRKVSSSSSMSGGREGACLRRIKREWRDAVEMGIAYDWIDMKTIKRPNAQSKHNYVRIGPFGKNLLQWHFSVQGPANSAYQDGIYHGRVLLPKDYPGSPPRIQVLTPSGRFIPGHDICLSASSYHPESWTPRWTVLSLVDALRIHMLTTANEIGGVNASSEKRRELARASRTWCVPKFGLDHEYMTQEGIFPLSVIERDDVEEEESKQQDDADTADNENDVAQKKTKVHRKSMTAAVRQAPTVKEVSVLQNFIESTIRILTSPVRLATLAFLTIFIILNKN